MTRRPIGIFFVATWLVFWFFLSGARSLQAVYGPQSFAANSPGGARIALLMLIGFTVWLVVSVVQLRQTALWVCGGLFAWWAISMLVTLPTFVTAAPRPAGAVLWASLIVGPNILAIWYLFRPSFRRVARLYRIERDTKGVRR